MQCFVYKGSEKQDHFLYLLTELSNNVRPEDVPVVLLDMLGDLSLVVSFELSIDRKMPNANPQDILNALNDQGYYYQMPRDSMFDSEERYFN